MSSEVNRVVGQPSEQLNCGADNEERGGAAVLQRSASRRKDCRVFNSLLQPFHLTNLNLHLPLLCQLK